jgi:hypothetical protein
VSGNESCNPKEEAFMSKAEGTVENVKLETLDEGRLEKYAKEQKIKWDKKAGIKGLVEAVVAQHSLLSREALCICDKCEGLVPDELEICPFCGEPLLPGESEASSVIGGGESEPDSPSEQARTEKGKTALARVETPVHMMPNIPKAVTLPVATEDLLERTVGEIQRLKRGYAENVWDLGKRLVEIAQEVPNRPALWTIRKGEDGKTQLYDSFKAFVRAEIGMVMSDVYSAMHVHTHYSREDFQLYSAQKVRIVLNAPEGEQKRLMREAQTLPLRQLREHVRDLNIAAGKHEKRRAARQKRATKEVEARDAKKGVVTVSTKDVTFLLTQATGKINLVKKEKNKDGELVAAKQVGDDAWGWIEGKNGVRLVLLLGRRPDGQLTIRYQSKRED